MDHGQPVESLLLYPSEGLLVSAGTQQYNPHVQSEHSKCEVIGVISLINPESGYCLGYKTSR